MSAKPSYLGAMPQDERVAAVVLSLMATGKLEVIAADGYLEFMLNSRKPLSNFGVKSDDFDLIWRTIVAAARDPRGFERLVGRMQRRKREPQA